MSNTTLGFSLTSLIAITKPIFLLIRKCPIVGIYYVYCINSTAEPCSLKLIKDKFVTNYICHVVSRWLSFPLLV